MDRDFDPYYKWLAIPPDEQPPNHYRLLGVPVFTDDPDVIENLAEQRLRHVRSFQIGDRSEFCFQILNEIAAARACLLDPVQRAAYDSRLRTEIGAARSTVIPPACPPPVPTMPVAESSLRGPSHSSSIQVIPDPVAPPSSETQQETPHVGPRPTQLAAVVIGPLTCLLLGYLSLGWLRSHEELPPAASPRVDALKEPEQFDRESPVTESRDKTTARETLELDGILEIADAKRRPGGDPIDVPPSDLPTSESPRPGQSASLVQPPVRPTRPSASPPPRDEAEPPSSPPAVADQSPADDSTIAAMISTSDGRGADAMVQIGTTQRLGGQSSIGIRTRRGAETNHSYLRFDLASANYSKSEVESVELLLSAVGSQRPLGAVIRVYGIPEAQSWPEGLLQWKNSFSTRGLASLPLLAQVTVIDDPAAVRPGRNVVRVSSPELANFVTSSDELVTFALAGSGIGDSILRFVSREGSAAQAPRLAIRTSPQPPTSDAGWIVNSIGMKLVRIPAGDFMMGSTDEDAEAASDEQPQHRRRIGHPFYLGETEVTQSQWISVMRTKPWSSGSFIKQGADYPATNVSWHDAAEFCRRLSAKERRRYSLPTEAQWEYACRAGTSTAFGHGQSAALLIHHAWFDKNSYDVDEKYAHQVRQKLPNAFGLYDMHGNVWEWCGDWYDENYYRKSPLTDPKGPPIGSFRVNRGGGWASEPKYCRSALRDKFKPDYTNIDLGFRVSLAEN